MRLGFAAVTPRFPLPINSFGSPVPVFCQVSPPSWVCSTTPRWPTAQPCSASTNCTAVRLTLTGTLAWRQVAPASSESSTIPRSPTATRRSPARASPSNTARWALAVGSAGCCSTANVVGCAATDTFAGIRPIDAPGFIVAQLVGTARQLLALRSYLRSARHLAERWSWTQEQIEAFEGSPEQRDLQREIDKVRTVFVAANPGYEFAPGATTTCTTTAPRPRPSPSRRPSRPAA